MRHERTESIPREDLQPSADNTESIMAERSEVGGCSLCRYIFMARKLRETKATFLIDKKEILYSARMAGRQDDRSNPGAKTRAITLKTIEWKEPQGVAARATWAIKQSYNLHA